MKVNVLGMCYVFLSATIIKGQKICGRPGKPFHTTFQNDKESYNINETVQYRCNNTERYHLIGNRKRTCLDNGTWSGSPPCCVRCVPPDLPFKGIFKQTNKSEGRLSCEEGYYLRGKSHVSCVNGLWDINGRYCESLIPSTTFPNGSARCGDPGVPSNGFFHINNSTEYELSYECDKGFVLIGPKERTCEQNGTWSPALPKCVKNVAMNKTAKLRRGQYNPNGSAGLSVDGIYSTCESLDGSPKGSKDFYGYIDLREKVLFDNLDIYFKNNESKDFCVYATNSSDVTQINFQEYKSLAKIYEGYYKTVSFLKPNITIKEIQYIVFWIRYSTSICEIIAFDSKEITDCGQPDQPLNGRILNRDSDVITFECGDGYAINGVDSVHCVNGVWENQLPMCFLIPPTVPPSEPTSTTEKATTPDNESESKNHLAPSTTSPKPESYIAKAIIGIGVGVVVTCIILIAAFCVFTKHRHRQSHLKQNLTKSNSQSNNSNSVVSEERKTGINEIKDDPDDFYENIETSNLTNFPSTNSNASARAPKIKLNPLPPYKNEDAITIENDLYETF